MEGASMRSSDSLIMCNTNHVLELISCLISWIYERLRLCIFFG